MKKLFKIFGFTLLFLILLIILLPIIFKSKIVDIVKEETNNALNAKVDFGDFDLGLITSFPNFKFTMNDITVDGIEQFDNIQLANIKNLTLKVNLMSVISGDKIKVKTIYIDEPKIHALVLADSTANWDIAKASDEENAVEEQNNESSSFKLGLKDLTIKNARIVYTDQTADLNTSIQGLDFHLSGDMTENVTDLVTHTIIDTLNLEMGTVKYFKNTAIKVDATLKADIANNKYTFTENEFSINELVLGLDGWIALFEDKEDIAMDLKFGAKQTTFKNILSLVPAVYLTDFATVKTAGKLSLDGYAKGNYTSTALPTFGINLQVEDAMFKYPDLPKSVDNIQVDLHVNNPGGSEDNTFIDLQRFYMELAGNPVDAALKIKTPISDPDIDAEIKAKLDLASIKDVIPSKGDDLNGNITSDIQLKGKISAIEKEQYQDFIAEGQFIVLDMLYKSDSLPYDVMVKQMYLNFSPQFVELAAFESQIGKSDINANGKIENFIAYAFADDEALKGRFNLNSNLMDLNEFMEEEGETNTEETTTEVEESLTVIEVPKRIDFSLNSSMKKVIYDNLTINNLKGNLAIKDQKVSMNKVAMDLLGGSMIMSGFYETTTPNRPGINYDMAINNFNIQEVVNTFNTIEEMAPYAKNAKGRFNTSLQIDGFLDKEMMPDLNALTGKGDMLTKNVKVEDLKVLTKLGDALNNDRLKTIRVEDTHVKYQFEEGRVHIAPFDIKMGKTTGTLSGSNGFDETIDYKMTLKTPSSELAGGKSIGKLNSQAASLGLDLKSTEFVSIDAFITGTIEDPKIKVSLKDAIGNIKEEIKEQVKEKVKEEIENVKDDAKEKAQEQVDKLLSEAKKQADNIRNESKKAGDAIRKEADKQVQKLMDEAGGNFLKKKAAEIAGKKITQQADKSATKVATEGNKRADGIMDKANQKADAIMTNINNK